MLKVENVTIMTFWQLGLYAKIKDVGLQVAISVMMWTFNLDTWPIRLNPCWRVLVIVVVQI